MAKLPDFRTLPSVETLAQDPKLASFADRVRRVAARASVARARASMKDGREVSVAEITESAVRLATQMSGPSLAPAINMSGVVLHTGLGRARLAREAQEQLGTVAGSHSLVELDQEGGGRGDRQEHVRGLLRELTGAEDALVVNNGAAAVVLALSALCAGKEVVLSRGQMVEIGGSFRLPDIVRHSACQLVEIGTTNKTRLSDYRESIGPATGAVLRCHPSNFQIVGFHEEPSAKELSEICREHGTVLIDDLGSGCLIDTESYGLPHERTISEALKDGADVVTASGDKLLGGPQAGLVLGTSSAIGRLAKHPLARAFRVCKLTLAALEATLRIYLEGRHEEIPVWRAVSDGVESVKTRAEMLARASKGSRVEAAETEIGGGSLPGVSVPSWRVGLAGDAESLAIALRALNTPVVGYIQSGTLWLDPRTATEEECALVASLLSEI